MEDYKNLPSIEVDVLVCGAGPAGIGAAIRAAESGAKTMIIEMTDCLGGIATAGMMSHWTGRSSSKIMLEIFNRQKIKSKVLGQREGREVWQHAINHEAYKIILEEMMQEKSVNILYYTLVCGSIVEDGKIKGIIIQNKSGRSVVYAKCVIDSTGDGDVAAYAGVPYFKGRESDGKMQPATLMFKVGGVDYDRAVFPQCFEDKVVTEKGELQALAKEKLPFPAGHVLLYPQTTDGTVCCNMTNAIGIDGTKTEDLTRALLTCRSQLEKIVKFLKDYVPGYERCWLMSSANLIGIRETRHFKGLSSLSPEDILTAKEYDTWVVKRAFFNFDVHNMTGASIDATGVQKNWKQNKDYTIPYGCLIPQNVENLLLSGRNISGSHLAHSNFRVMPICMAIGEAAGAAAGIFVKEKLSSLKDVNVKKIQSIVGE